jgi:hypothetical protein
MPDDRGGGVTNLLEYMKIRRLLQAIFIRKRLDTRRPASAPGAQPDRLGGRSPDVSPASGPEDDLPPERFAERPRLPRGAVDLHREVALAFEDQADAAGAGLTLPR